MYRIQIRECSPVLGYVLQRGAINCQKLSRHTRPTKMCSVTSVVTRSGASNTAHYAKLKFRKKRKRYTVLVVLLPARICKLSRLGCRVTAIAMKVYREEVPHASAKCGFVRPNALRTNLWCGLTDDGLPLAAFRSDV